MCHRLRGKGGKKYQRGKGCDIVLGAMNIYAASRQNVTYFPSCLPPVILSASEGSRYLPIVTQKLVNTSRQEGTAIWHF